ncbi:hypothetical protein HYU19_01285 [Candidatus Woesearchaeota archaeon]|nr:hypothetical protein [Candidatus Woesearchaeota archaeon]
MAAQGGLVEVDYVEDRLRSSMQSSFKKVRDDMKQLQQWQQFLVNDARDTRKNLEGLRKDAITNEKFNILRIYLNEVKQELKKAEQLQQSIDGIRTDYLSKKDFQAYAAELLQQLRRVERVAKQATPQEEFRKLAAEVNTELDHVKEDMAGVENRGGKVVDARIDHFMESFNNKVAELKQQVAQYRDETSRFIKKSHVEELVHDINTEFNTLKQVVEELVLLQRDAEEKIQRLRKRLREEEEQGKAGMMAGTRGKGTSLSRTPSSRAAANVMFKTGNEQESASPSWRWLKACGGVLIALSFASIAGSIGAYAANKLAWIDWLVASAVILFAVGTVLWAIASVKQGREQAQQAKGVGGSKKR